jgi:acyl transferase domain-containing protein
MLPLIFAGVTAVVSSTGTYLFTRSIYEAKLSELSAAHATALADANAKALEDSRTLAAKVEAVQVAAEKRRRAIAADRDRAVTELVRLRDTATDAATRACGDPSGTKSEPALALADVLGQCSGLLVEIAAAADGHASDAMTLRDAWPR